MDLHSPEASIRLIQQFDTVDDITGKGNSCESDTHQLGKHQKSAMSIVKMLCHKDNANRGLLLWHSTGSGKTLSGTCLMDAVWDQPDRNIMYISSVGGIEANPESVFHKNAMRFLPRFAGKTEDEVAGMFSKRKVEFFSFAQLAHVLQIHRPRKAKDAAEAELWANKLQDTLLIIDEVHALLTPFKGQKNECDKLMNMLTNDNTSKTKGLKVVLMTATPGNTIQDVLRVLNVLRDPGSPLIDFKNKQDFTRSIRGLVSFFDYSADLSRYPKVATKVHRSTLTMEQAVAIAEKTGPMPSEQTLDRMSKSGNPHRFWQLARSYTNTLYDWPKDMPLASFSSKMELLLRIIQEHSDSKHLVYSAFGERRGYGGHGARAIVRALKDKVGMTEHKGDADMKPGERVALLSSGQPVDDIVAAYNDKKNAKGSVLRVLVATQAYKESFDLKGVRHIHVFEPLVSVEDHKQLVGRGVRMCSHADLAYPDEWTVTIHTYVADPPDVASKLEAIQSASKRVADYIHDAEAELTVLKGVRGQPAVQMRRSALKSAIADAKKDKHGIEEEASTLNLVSGAPNVDSEVYTLAKRRGKEVEELLQVLRDNAVDCLMFKEFHEKGGIKVSCSSDQTSKAPVSTKTISRVKTKGQRKG
jgi:hypothetical protein